jgi:hypothetical protein
MRRLGRAARRRAAGTRRDRRRPARPAGARGDRLRDRPSDRLGVCHRCSRSALGGHVRCLRPSQGRRLPRRPRGRAAGQGRLRRPRAAGPDVVSRAALRRVDRPRRRLQRAAWRSLRQAHDDPARAARPRLEQRHPRHLGRKAGHGHLVGLRPLHADVEVVGDDRLVPSRRQRRAHLRQAHPGAVRPRLLPGHERPAREHEPARRPRDADAGRLAGPRLGRRRLALPRVLRTGRRRLRRRPWPDRGARQARRRGRSRRRDRSARRLGRDRRPRRRVADGPRAAGAAHRLRERGDAGPDRRAQPARARDDERRRPARRRLGSGKIYRIARR